MENNYIRENQREELQHQALTFLVQGHDHPEEANEHHKQHQKATKYFKKIY